MNTNRHQQGSMLILVLLLGSILVLALGALFSLTEFNSRVTVRANDRELAFRIAEAGIEYYRWHLAHAPSDYRDGTNQPGPYVHNYYDKSGALIGTFSLDITAPPVGSTIVKIRSTGTIAGLTNLSKIVEVKLAKPSFAKYAIVTNDNARFGVGTEIFGPIHSNGGIRFDGIAHNIVTSAVANYDDPDHTGANEFGVHTHVDPVDPLPPAAVPNRPDVFVAGRTFPVPAVDFANITSTLSQIKAAAIASGSYSGPSGAQGYEIVLKTNDVFDLYRVNTLVAAPSNCTNIQNQTGWGTWSVNTRTLLNGNKPIPANGLIFLEDNVWVRGTISSARVTIASGRFPVNPSTYSSITVNSDLAYTNYDGQDALSLISQNDINIGMVSDDDLRIDGALVAQNGRVGRYYYRPPGGGQNRCSPYHVRTTLTTFGMIGSYIRYGFAYTDNTGYTNRTLNYDTNLLYAPPPSFPSTSDGYQQISWQEIK